MPALGHRFWGQPLLALLGTSALGLRAEQGTDLAGTARAGSGLEPLSMYLRHPADAFSER